MDRFFRNAMFDDADQQPVDSDVRDKLLQAVTTALSTLEKDISSDRGVRGPSIYVGNAGIALMYLRLAFSIQRLSIAPSELPDNFQSLLQKAVLQIEQCPQVGRKPGFIDGLAGCLAMRACVLQSNSDHEAASQAVEELLKLCERSNQMPPSECEVLYGRAGLLLSLLLVRRCVGEQSVPKEALHELIRQLIQEGKRTAEESTDLKQYGLMYCWHQKYYLGAAHGVVGILHVLLSCWDEVESCFPEGDALQLVQRCALALVDEMMDSGNLPSSIGNTNDRLVQWCHGAPGLLLLLQHCCKVLPADLVSPVRQMGFLQALEYAADSTWYRGLVKKGVGLCHGICGNGYGLLAAYQATGKEVYLRRATQYALFAADHWEELYNIPDRPVSLYEGLAGAVCYWLDVLDPHNAAFPAFQLPPEPGTC